MSDFGQERTTYNRRVDQAHARVDAIERFLAGLRLNDPVRPEVEGILQKMRQSACDAELNRAMFRFEDDQIAS